MENKYNHGVLFYHEHSGLKDIYEGLGEVTKSLSSMCKHLSIQLSENEGDIIKYCEAIKNDKYGSEIDILFILGGDGTVNELVNGVMQHDLHLPVGIIPGGTFNDFTKTLNLDPNFKNASSQLLSAQVGSYDVMKVNDTYVLNFVGLGLIVQNAENVQEGSKDVFGKLSYIGSTVKTLMNPSKFDFELNIDGRKETGNTSMLLIANGPNIGGGRVPLTDLSPQDGKVDTFIFDDQSFSILNDIFKKRDSMNWNEITEGIDHIPGQHITLSTEPNMKVDIDGEISLETPIEIEVLPKAIQLLTFPEFGK
ncbi:MULTISPECIES: diacylglycerol/lipid kinase family protein [Staphylococcus]|jgi:putative lipid kinase SH2167|uniref:diacylglycerol/lipid kinase family protein n=1 Tax=Staphylococcus TaxID=1279 RepID=UPI0001EF49E7|nr:MULTISPECIES: diacylglycerol kinase family protein [Staphylococcus]EFS18113.1 BmrU protein [Staphylococcus capitis C87]MBC3049915.1 diacylglycerol kinase family lipid kinase [Staphylococcus capitis]MBC3069851.1 diacylglycerol kinase family lipid kinase [Staphylococcus capitis]MCK6220978.1 diacylglycerol kinase family lipid kinase [Staphylococcus capitis]MCM3283657.1 diacylglycerol kinase family lipid kinase [Staphylococcus capitis]